MTTNGVGFFSTLFGGGFEEGGGDLDTKSDRQNVHNQNSSNGKWSATRWAPQKIKSHSRPSSSPHTGLSASSSSSSSSSSHGPCIPNSSPASPPETSHEGKRNYSRNKFETYDSIEGDESGPLKKAITLSDRKDTVGGEAQAGRTMFIVESKGQNRDIEAGYEEGLYTAAKLGDEETILYLIKKGANVNFPNGVENLESPLHAACVEGNLDAAFALLNNKGDLNQRDGNGQTPLEASTQQLRTCISCMRLS